jgi:hypothetical protein
MDVSKPLKKTRIHNSPLITSLAPGFLDAGAFAEPSRLYVRKVKP